jgi:WD40 repeat protein/Tfp pilus assembly protein PilF
VSLSLLDAEELEQALRSACSDLGRRIRAGESCSAEEYLARYPEIAAQTDLALELIYTEYVVRTELSQDVSYDDWLTRFPQWRSDLEQLIEVHRQVCDVASSGATVRRDRLATPAPSGGAVPAANSMPAVRRIGHHELIEEIGRGGMGVVYRARQSGLNRHVALKMVLAGDFAGARELQRFRREAEAAARLQHPHIVQIFEVGEHEGRPYFSMELMTAGRLDEILVHATLPPRHAAVLLSRLAGAVHYAHQRGVVHRDLKPGNVLLAPGDRESGVPLGAADEDLAYYEPKIADFGLAKQFCEENGQHTRSGAVVGTPSYMSPEQARGQPGTVGPASDVYALGAILYESPTGRPPFLGNSPLETLRQVLHEEPPSLARWQPKLPRDLVTICLKCLDKDAARRYGSAAELADDLGRFLRGEPIHARAVGPAERAVKWSRRHPAVAALAVTLAAVTLLGFVTVFVFWRHAESGRTAAEDERGKAVRARVAAEDARTAAERARLAAERLLYIHRVGQAHAEWQAFRVGRAEELLDQCPAALRDWEWSYLKTLCHSDLRTLRGLTDHVSSVAYSPDGKLVAAGSGQWASGRSGEVILWDAATGEIRATLRGQDGQITSVAFSPDSQRIAACSQQWDNPNPPTLKVWSIAGDELLTLSCNAWDAAFSPDGRLLAACSGDGVVRLWNVGDGTLWRQMDGHSKSTRKMAFQVAFSPDGKLLASAGSDGSCRVYDCQTGEEELAITGYGDLRRVAFSPDGRYLAFSSLGDALMIRDLTQPDAQPVVSRQYNGRINAFAYSPEGRRIAVAGMDGSVRILSLANLRTSAGEQKTLHVHTGHVLGLAFSPDGRVLATGGIDRTVKLSDAQTDAAPDNVRVSGTGFFHRLAFTPDGDRLLLPSGYNTGSPGSGARALAGWDFKTSAAMKYIQGHTGWLTDVAVSPDGKLFATSSEDQTARLWDAATGAELRKLRGHAAAVTSVAISPDSRHAATAGADGTVRIWDAASGATIRELRGHDGGVTVVRYCPGGHWLASAGADGTVRLWIVESGVPREPLRGHEATINFLAFRHDGKLLASAGADGTARVWDVATGEVLHVLRGHQAAVNNVCFSATGRRLATSSNDWTVKLWDAESGEEVLTLRMDDRPRGLAFSPDGRRLVAARGVKLSFWDTDPSWTTPGTIRAFDDASRAWHEREAKTCETGKQHFATAFHVGRLIQQQPDHLPHYRRRGHVWAELGEWDRAQADFAVVLEQHPNDALVDSAHMKLAQGCTDEYRDSCQHLLDAIDDLTSARAVNNYAWHNVLVPVPDAGTARLVALSERAVCCAATETDRNAHISTLAAALYRAGRFEEARQWFEKSVAQHGAGGYLEDRLFLAMTEQRLGNAARARHWLDQAESFLADPPDKYPNDVPVFSPWYVRIGWQMLHREAESLIRPPAPPP